MSGSVAGNPDRNQPAADAPCIAALKANGAVLLGKTGAPAPQNLAPTQCWPAGCNPRLRLKEARSLSWHGEPDAARVLVGTDTTEFATGSANSAPHGNQPTNQPTNQPRQSKPPPAATQAHTDTHERQPTHTHHARTHTHTRTSATTTRSSCDASCASSMLHMM